jgi:predicted enzyme related to lactoylglutathione lyase
MMIKKIGCLEIPVSNMERATAFYENVVKLRKTYEHPVWTAFDVGGVTFALAASGTKGGKKGARLCTSCSPCVFRNACGKSKSDKEAPSLTCVIYFQVENLDTAYRRFRERGVEFIAEPKEQGWGGRTAVMLDPDKNIIVLSEVEESQKQVIECKPPEALVDLGKP